MFNKRRVNKTKAARPQINAKVASKPPKTLSFGDDEDAKEEEVIKLVKTKTNLFKKIEEENKKNQEEKHDNLQSRLGEYTNEKMQQLRTENSFLFRKEEEKLKEEKMEVNAEELDKMEGIIISDQIDGEEEDKDGDLNFRIPDSEAIRRAKLKRDRIRRIGGNLNPSSQSDFIPLNSNGPNLISGANNKMEIEENDEDEDEENDLFYDNNDKIKFGDPGKEKGTILKEIKEKNQEIEENGGEDEEFLDWENLQMNKATGFSKKFSKTQENFNLFTAKAKMAKNSEKKQNFTATIFHRR